MEKRTENCYIYGKGCEVYSYDVSSWRELFSRSFPNEHYFYNGFEFTNCLGLSNAKQVIADYLSPYFKDSKAIWSKAGADNVDIVSDALPYYTGKCKTCPKASDSIPDCSKKFSLVFFVKLQMRASAFCGINGEDCKKCRMNPKKSTKLARDHRNNEKNRKSLVVSDLRLGGHAVKVIIDFVYYRCPHIEKAIRTLPFLYGDSIDKTRISKRLSSAISGSLLNGVGPKFISEACAIPHDTIKKWWQRDRIISKRSAELLMAKELFQVEGSLQLPHTHTAENFAYIIALSSEPALSRIYSKEEWDTIRRFICTKTYHFANYQISYPHLFLLAFDYLVSLKYKDHPVVRALFVCMKYAAETGTFDQLREFVVQCCADAAITELTYEAGYPSEFYRLLALRGRRTNRKIYSRTADVSLKEAANRWWDMFHWDASSFFQTYSLSPKPDEEQESLLHEVDQWAMCSAFHIDETADLLAYYNPMLLIHNNTFQDNNFPRADTGGIDYSRISPKGVPLDMLLKMLRVGYLTKDSDQSIWQRLETSNNIVI